MGPLRLRDDVSINVTYDDRTPFGSATGDGPEHTIHAAYAAAIEYAHTNGYAALVEAGPEILAKCVASEAFGAIAEPAGDAWRLRSEWLYPDPSHSQPRFLTLAREDAETDGIVRLQLPSGHWPMVHDLLAELSGEGVADERRLHDDLRTMLGGCREQGLLTDDPEPAIAPSVEGDLHFAGHNMVVVTSRRARIVIDPFLFAQRDIYPASYQPVPLRALGEIDGILLTHSHRDHFVAASLLRFPRETKIVVPCTERETVIAFDMATRLRELGFTDVVELAWGSSIRIADIDVHALPFFGEQPTDGAVLHPDVRNVGNTYLVRTTELGAVFLADSGTDGSGSVRDVAEQAMRAHGPVDAVFGGYRGWLTYPVQLLFSSVGRYLPFVPPHQWGVRQRLMNGIDEAIDTAERFGARVLVPYADGGAPWHWGLGLGPRLDEPGHEVEGFDPSPLRVREAAARRVEAADGTLCPSPVSVVVLRPNDGLSVTGVEPTVHRPAENHWPYAEV